MNFNEKVEEFNRVLNEYNTNLGLHCIQYNEDVQEVLMFTREDYKGLTAEDCYIHVADLKYYSLYLQKEFNRHSSIKEWAERNLKIIIAEHWDQFAGDGYNSYDLISSLIIRKIGPATTLKKIIEKASSRVSELTSISYKVDGIANILEKMGDSKRFKK